MDYQWYPGHMTKARRMMEENIGLVDLVIELTDARIPMSSRNPDIDKLSANKARILVMTKADLADPVRTAAFQRAERRQHGRDHNVERGAAGPDHERQDLYDLGSSSR